MCSTENISQSGAQCVLHRLWHSFAKLSYSEIDNVLTNLLPAGLHDLSGAQRLECEDDGKQADGVLARWNSLLGLSLGYSAANWRRTNALSSLVNRCDFIFTSTTSAMASHININYCRIFKCTFLSCLLICLHATSFTGIILCKFS